MALDPALRIALADPRGNINPNQDSLSLAELAAEIASTLGLSASHWLEGTDIIEGLTSGVDIMATLDAYAKGSTLAQPSRTPLWVFRAGATAMLYTVVDNRRCLLTQAAAGAYSTNYLRPFVLTGLLLFASDYRPTYGAVTSTPGADVPPLLAIRVSAWFRKRLAGDSSSCRTCFGFADNTFLSPTALIARCGLLGDGAGGYRFGSVNCPDGQAAGENAPGDIDAGSIQPAELTNANLGTNWFHVEIRMIPPTPTQGGMWSARLNGTLVKIFTDSLVNFPRGSGTTDNNYARIEGLFMTNEGAVNILYRDRRVVVTEDLTP